MKKTNWIMHEFSLVVVGEQENIADWVLSVYHPKEKIRIKSWG
jgi:hypothetical protein